MGPPGQCRRAAVSLRGDLSLEEYPANRSRSPSRICYPSPASSRVTILTSRRYFLSWGELIPSPNVPASSASRRSIPVKPRLRCREWRPAQQNFLKNAPRLRHYTSILVVHLDDMPALPKSMVRRPITEEKLLSSSPALTQETQPRHFGYPPVSIACDRGSFLRSIHAQVL